MRETPVALFDRHPSPQYAHLATHRLLLNIANVQKVPVGRCSLATADHSLTFGVVPMTAASDLRKAPRTPRRNAMTPPRQRAAQSVSVGPRTSVLSGAMRCSAVSIFSASLSIPIQRNFRMRMTSACGARSRALVSANFWMTVASC
jgi:hypothetical protein